MFSILIVVVFIAQFPMLPTVQVFYKTTKMDCIHSPVYIRNTICKVKPINRYKSVSNMDCDIVQPLRNVSLHLEVFQRNSANIYKPFIINVTSNVCDILDKKNFPGYTTIIMKILRIYSNVNHSCPFKGHLLTRKLYMDERVVPFVFPFGMYKGVFRFLEGYPYKEIGTVSIYMETMEKRDDQVDPRVRHKSKTN